MLSPSMCEAEVTVSVGHVQLRETLGKGPPLDLVRQEIASKLGLAELGGCSST